ncbi:hypothetical protein [uncultured Winogradskyella sp.]|uniref:hypothetical protein n=1 Tax=uncultured Winogradskyella sp. TaxID=395353 RepID=UPI002611E16E|nr:hypothetical protein [uncultured Winogradskyella sp.]
MSSVKTKSWSILDKIGFRFIFIYFLLFIAFQNNSAYPFWYTIFSYPLQWMKKLVPWLGENVYGITEITFRENTGSGDTLFDYVTLLTIFLAAVIGAIIWSLIDRKRFDYKKLYYWLTVAVRYYIALMLIAYGLSKVIQLQFPYPGPYRMLSEIGNTSPMGLAWTFLGFSKGYNIFMGIAELLAVLLLFRRTLTFGLVITLMTTLNVMAVNYFYDVPVKMVSTHLVIMTLFLLSRDIKKLCLFFFTNIKTKLSVIERPVFNKGITIAIKSFKALIIGYALIYGFVNVLENEKLYGAKAEKPLLYGAYEITNITVNGDTLNDYRDNRLWKHIGVQWQGSLRIQRYSSPKTTYYGIEKDSLKDRFKLTSWSRDKETFYMNFKEVDSATVNFDYISEKDTINVYTKKMNKNSFTLSRKEFTWISEYPFNM